MPAKASPSCTIKRLTWTEPEFGTLEAPRQPMRILGGFGSGLTIWPDDDGSVWAICDRGPNLKLKTAIERYGLTQFEGFDGGPDAKIMPRLDLGPAIAELRVEEDRVELVRTIRLANAQGRGAARPAHPLRRPRTMRAGDRPAVQPARAQP